MRMNIVIKRKTILILLLLLWMITVFLFSAQNATRSSKVSGNLTDTILDLLNVSKEHREMAETLIRKLAHFTIYAVGGVLAMCCFSECKLGSNKNIIVSQMFGTLYAITDEVHQYFVPGRACQLRDVLIDSLGVASGIIIALIIREILTKKEGR